jgi:hypothetical protein
MGKTRWAYTRRLPPAQKNGRPPQRVESPNWTCRTEAQALGSASRLPVFTLALHAPATTPHWAKRAP